MNKRFQIIPIVEGEIIPDISLELIKGGGTNSECVNFTCGVYDNCFTFTCKGNTCPSFINGKCNGGVICGSFGSDCRDLVVGPDPCMTNLIS